jgi:hypothetical protein
MKQLKSGVIKGFKIQSWSKIVIQNSMRWFGSTVLSISKFQKSWGWGLGWVGGKRISSTCRSSRDKYAKESSEFLRMLMEIGATKISPKFITHSYATAGRDRHPSTVVSIV